MTAADRLETAAERVEAYLDVRATLPWQSETVVWAANDEHGTREITVGDLTELLRDNRDLAEENARLRAQDHEGQLRVAEAYRDAFGLRPWEIRQMHEQEARRQA